MEPHGRRPQQEDRRPIIDRLWVLMLVIATVEVPFLALDFYGPNGLQTLASLLGVWSSITTLVTLIATHVTKPPDR